MDFHVLIVGLILVLDVNKSTGTTNENIVQNPGNLLQYRQGDILLAGLMRVHKREGEFCSDIQDDGIQAVETMNMVIDQVNRNTSILRGIKLGTVMVDTCDVDSHALQRIVIDILPLIWNVSIKSPSSSPRPDITSSLLAGVVGAASSAVSIQAANLLQTFAIPQVSYWSTSPDLSNKVRFKYFFRTVPSDSNQASAMIAVVKNQNWTYISVVYEDDFYGVRGFTQIQEIAKHNNICIAISQAVPRTPTEQDFRSIITQLLTKQEAKAVIVFTKKNDAIHLLEAAQTMSAANSFLWIGSDGWSRQIPVDGKIVLKEATVDGSLGFTPKTSELTKLTSYFTALTIADHQGSNVFRNPWFEEYISKMNNCSLSGENGKRKCEMDEKIDPSEFHPLNKMQSVADAVLAFVHALDQYHKQACQGKAGMCAQLKILSGTNKLASGVYETLKNLSFTGINGGKVHFDENQDGPAIYNILNYQQNASTTGSSNLEKWVNVGTYDTGNISWYTNLSKKIEDAISVCSQPCGMGEATIRGIEICCWHCLPCQEDEYVSANGSQCLKCKLGEKTDITKTGCISLAIQEMKFSDTYSIVCLVLGSLGLLLTLIVTLIYVKYRDTPIVKASGRELCFFVLFGIFLTFTNCISFTTPATTPSCITSRIIIAIGPTCMYAGLLTKTIRVVIIFRSRFLSAKIKDFLRPMPQLISTLGVVFVQALVLVGWFTINGAEAKVKYPDVYTAFRACNSLVEISILIGLIYPFLLIIVCTVLATVNRNVPIGFNETQYIGFSMYTTCIIWLAFIPIFATNTTDIAQRIMTTSVCLSLSATTVLFCLFGPRCFNILFHPEINTQQSVMTASSMNFDRGGVPGSLKDKNSQNRSQESTTGEKDGEKVNQLKPSSITRLNDYCKGQTGDISQSAVPGDLGHRSEIVLSPGDLSDGIKQFSEHRIASQIGKEKRDLSTRF